MRDLRTRSLSWWRFNNALNVFVADIKVHSSSKPDVQVTCKPHIGASCDERRYVRSVE